MFLQKVPPIQEGLPIAQRKHLKNLHQKAYTYEEEKIIIVLFLFLATQT